MPLLAAVSVPGRGVALICGAGTLTLEMAEVVRCPNTQKGAVTNPLEDAQVKILKDAKER